MGSFAGSVFPVQMALFVVANALVVLLGLHLAGWGRLVMHLESAGSVIWRRISPAGKRFLPADMPVRAVALGMIWGWLPCGLVYSALALALVSGHPLRGALVLIAFGLGTLPSLLAAGLVAQRLRLALRTRWIRMLAGGDRHAWRSGTDANSRAWGSNAERDTLRRSCLTHGPARK